MKLKRHFDTTCPVCSELNNRWMYDIKQGSLARCHTCNLVFYTPRPTSKELINYYNSELYRDAYRSGDMVGQDFANNRYAQFEKALNDYDARFACSPRKCLLDIGCGTGDFLLAALQHDWQVEGVEISEKTVQQANKKIGKNSVKMGFFDEIDLPESFYNTITAYHVIEHLICPMTMLKRSYQLLKPGGIIFLETPNIGGLGARFRGKKWSQIKPLEHINYFNNKSLAYALEQAGFVDIHTFTIKPQKIQSVASFQGVLKSTLSAFYGFAPLLNLGASLQAIATKPKN